MDDAGLFLLRLLTMVTRLCLAAALLVLVVKRGASLTGTSRQAWVALASVFTILAFDNLGLEVFAGFNAYGIAPEVAGPLHKVFYHVTYLLHAVLAAALPAVVLSIYLQARRGVMAAAMLAPVALVTVVAVARGALSDWGTLLSHSRYLSFLSIGAFLVFWTFVLLGRVRRVDAYLAGFIAVETLFEVLLPIQEIFFQLAGSSRAKEMWHLSQFLQFATAAAELAVVLAMIGALSRGRAVGVVRVPV